MTDICCICLDDINNYDNNTINLDCCNQKLHKICFMDWILIKGVVSNCPMCRKNISNLNEVITLNDIYDNISNFSPNNMKKIDNANIIINHYFCSNSNNSISIGIDLSDQPNDSSENTNRIEYYKKILISAMPVILLIVIVFIICMVDIIVNLNSN